MRFSKKFFIGVVLIITNFIVGKIAIPFFAVEVELGMGIYLFSWLMLIAGLLLCGREGLSYARMLYRDFRLNLKQKASSISKRRKSVQIQEARLAEEEKQDQPAKCGTQ